MKRSWKFGLFLLVTLLMSGFLWMGITAKAHAFSSKNQSVIGGMIAYVGSDGDIYLYDSDAGARIQLTEDAEWFDYSQLQFSPDRSAMAFLKSNPEAGASVLDLYIMELVDRESVRVLENIGDYDWHPDGNSIAFGYKVSDNCQSPDQESTNGIMHLDLQTGSITELIPPVEANVPVGMPEYSSSGDWITYQSYPCFSSGYQTILGRLPEGDAIRGVGSYDWSPVNDHILSVEWAYGEMQSVLYDINPETEAATEIMTDPIDSLSGPKYSPDANWVVLSQSTKPDDYFFDMMDYPDWKDNLMIIDSGGVILDTICEGDAANVCVFEAWSPDGRQVLFTEMVDGQPAWTIYDLELQTSMRLAEGFGVGGVQWHWDHGEIQWVNAAAVSEPSPEPTVEEKPSQDPTVDITDDAPVESEPSVPTQGQPETQSGPNIALILILAGGCLVGVSIVIVIIIVIMAKRKKDR